MIRFKARRRSRVGQDASAPASLLMSITVASLPVMVLWQTHAGRRPNFWQGRLNGIGLKPEVLPLGLAAPLNRLYSENLALLGASSCLSQPIQSAARPTIGSRPATVKLVAALCVRSFNQPAS